MAPKKPQMAPKWPETASQRGLKCTKTHHVLYIFCLSAFSATNRVGCPKMAVHGPKMAPKWPQDGPKIGPKSPQDGPGSLSGPIFCPSWPVLGLVGPFSAPRGAQDSPKMVPKRPQMARNGSQNKPKWHPKWPPKGRCLQKSPADRLPAIQERLPAKLAAELPVETACNNFLDGGRSLREAARIINNK